MTDEEIENLAKRLGAPVRIFLLPTHREAVRRAEQSIAGMAQALQTFRDTVIDGICRRWGVSRRLEG